MTNARARLVDRLSIACAWAVIWGLVSAVACGPTELEPLVPPAPPEAGVAEAGNEPSAHADALPDAGGPSAPLVVALAGGGGHVCTLLDDGAVACWGDNFKGQVGVAEPRAVMRPMRVAGLGRPAIAIAAGSRHTCATLDDTSVHCWGANDMLQRGDLDASASTAPGPEIVRGAARLAAGDVNTCVLVDAGLTCWGANDFGQIDSILGPEMSTPVPVEGFANELAGVGIGFRFLCAWTMSGAVVCRGRNEQGQLGRGMRSVSETSPVAALYPASAAAQVVVGARHACAIREDATVACFGAGDEGQLGAPPTDGGAPVVPALGPPESGARLRALAAGYEHTCGVIEEDGTVVCWGGNTFGQVGLDPRATPDGSITPTRVPGLADVVAVAATDFATCALRKDGRVLCWGANTHGDLGDGTSDARFTPKEVTWP